MMHVRGRAASKDDLEIARRSALTQEKISFGVTHVEPMGGYGRVRATVSKQKRPATAQVRRPTRPSSGRVRPQSAQVRRPASAPRSTTAAQRTARGGTPRLQRGRISPDLIDDAPAEPTAEEPERIYDRTRGRSYLPPANATGGVASSGPEKRASRLDTVYNEKVPRVGCAVPLHMPEVDGQELPAQGGSAPTSKSGAQRYPDILLLESWMNEMAERVLVNKQQEVFSKAVFDRSLLSYTMDAKHGEAEVHNMWIAAQQGLGRFGCTREQLYDRHMESDAVERLYRAFYIYSVGLPTAVRQITQAAVRKEPTTGAGLPVLCLSTFLHLFMEVLKSTHGDSVATEVEDSFVSGVHARVQAYIDSLEALRSEHEALQQRAAALQAEVDENGDESTQQKIQRMNEAIYSLQNKVKAMMKSHAVALAQKEKEVEDAEREANEARKLEAEVRRFAAEERQQAAAREKELQAEIERMKAEGNKLQSEWMRSMETMVDETSRLRNEQWVSRGERNLSQHTHGTGPELVNAHAAAVASIVKAVAAEREDVNFKRERDEKARAIKEHKRDRELQEERAAAEEALLEQQRAVQREKNANENLQKQLDRLDLVLARERATVKDCRRSGKLLAVHQFAMFCAAKRRLRLTMRSLKYAEKAVEQAVEDKRNALIAQETERDRRKNELGESLESQQKQLAAMLAEVEVLKFELRDSKTTLASKEELQKQVDAGHKKIRELLSEIERLNSVHSGEMATREMHIGRIEVQLQAAQSSSNSATAELRQARSEHVAYVAQASMRKDKLQAQLDKYKSAKDALVKWKAEAEKREAADKQTLADLQAKLAEEQSLDRDLQANLRADIKTLEKAARKAEFALQRTQQLRQKEEANFKSERSVLQKTIDEQVAKLEKADRSMAHQKRLLSSMEDERDLMQATCNNLEQTVVAEKRSVFDANKTKSEAEKHYQRMRREIKSIEDDRDEALGRLKNSEEIRKQLTKKIEDLRLADERRVEEIKRRRKAAMQAEAFGAADVGVQASDDAPSEADMLAALEQLRIVETALKRSQQHCEEARKREREALESYASLRREMERLEPEAAGAEPVPATGVGSKHSSPTDSLDGSTRTVRVASTAPKGYTRTAYVASGRDDTNAATLADAGMAAPERTGGEVDVQRSSELPDNLSSLMHQSPPEYVRHMSLKSVLSIVRKLYAHCSQVLVECVGPSMQSLGECIYQFFELKYGRATTLSTESKYAHELHIYEFISNVLRLEHESPALALFARFAGVVDEVYSVEGFRFFLYALSCLDTGSLIDQPHGGTPKVFTSKGRGHGSEVESGVSQADQIWLSEEYAMQIFQKIIPHSAPLVKIMEYELRSVISHRPSRRSFAITACVEHDAFLLKVMELWNEVTPAEDGGSLVKKREDMFLRREGSGEDVAEDVAVLYLDRWRALGTPADGVDRRNAKT